MPLNRYAIVNDMIEAMPLTNNALPMPKGGAESLRSRHLDLDVQDSLSDEYASTRACSIIRATVSRVYNRLQFSNPDNFFKHSDYHHILKHQYV